MMQPLLAQRVGQRPDHVLLPYQLGKSLGAPLAGEDLGHSGIGKRLKVSNKRRLAVAAASP
jgi:hypothetical protein